jgi:phage gp45-like
MASPNDTVITPNFGTITDSSGDTFSITNVGTVDMNGAPLGYTANVIDAAWINGNFWQQNSSGLWWEYTGNPNAPWTGLGTSASPLAGHPSQSGTLISPGSGVIADNQGDTFAVTAGGTIDINGQPLGYTANVTEAAYVNGHFWQENSSGLWWEYTGNPASPLDWSRHIREPAA